MDMHTPTAAASPSASADDSQTPLAVMLAVMRWTYALAEPRTPQLVGRAAVDAAKAAKAAVAVHKHALEAAKAAAPYVHARVAAPRPATTTSRAARRRRWPK